MAQVAIDYSRILFDNTGKPYWNRMDGSKVYLPPLVAAQSHDPRAKQWAQSMGVAVDPGGQVTSNNSAPGGSYFKDRGHWNAETGQWDQDTNWENIITTSLAGIPLAAGGAAVANSIAGGGGAAAQTGAGGTLASSTIPNAHLAVPTTAGMGSQGASAGLGMLGLNGAGSALANGAASGGGGVLGKLKDFFTNPQGIAGLGGIIGALASGAGGSGGAGTGSGGGSDLEELKRINQITEARMRRVDPLHQAVTQLAFGRLPINSRAGVTAPVPTPLPEPR
jgi:hypothetical protein